MFIDFCLELSWSITYNLMFWIFWLHVFTYFEICLILFCLNSYNVCLTRHIKGSNHSSCKWSHRFVYLNFSLVMITGGLSLILVDSPMLTFGVTPGDFLMMLGNMLTLNKSKCLSVWTGRSPHSTINTFKIWCTNMGRSLGRVNEALWTPPFWLCARKISAVDCNVTNLKAPLMLPQPLASLPLGQSLKNFMLDETSTSVHFWI